MSATRPLRAGTEAERLDAEKGLVGEQPVAAVPPIAGVPAAPCADLPGLRTPEPIAVAGAGTAPLVAPGTAIANQNVVALPVGGAARIGTRGARLGIAGLLLGGGVVAVGAARTNTLLSNSIRPLPAGSPLGGAFQGLSFDLHTSGVIVALTLMLISYAVVVVGSGRLSGRAVVGAILLLHAVVLLAPPIVSTDVFSYQAYARMGSLYAINPYTHGPYAINLDSVFPYIGAYWSYYPSVYGPLFTVFSYLLAPLSVAASVFAYKSIATLASLGLIAIVWRCARLRGRDPVRAAAIVGCNPLLVVYGVGGGHNDLVMLLAMGGALYALLASRSGLGGALGALAVGLKLTAGLIVPFAFADPRLRSDGGRRRLAFGVAVGAAVVLTVGFAVFGSGLLQMFVTLDRVQAKGGDSSVPGFIATVLGLPSVGHIAGFVLAGVFVAFCGWLLTRVWRGRLDWIDAAGWAMLGMLLGTGSLLPWYVAWLLPLAALARDRRIVPAALVVTGVVACMQMISYIPHYPSLL